MARRPPEGDQGEARAILRRITEKLSRTQKPDVEKTLRELREGYHEYQTGEAKGTKASLSAGASIEKIVRLLRAGVSPDQIPGEVAQRFDWSVVLDDLERYAAMKKVDAAALKRALSPRTKRPRARPSGTYRSAEAEVEAVAKKLGVSPKRLASALTSGPKKRR